MNNKIELGSVIYIAGPITGIEDYRERFKAAEDELEALGYIPINPAEFEGTTSELSPEQYSLMIRHCAMIISLRADVLVLLPDWHKSRGAIKERNIAYALEIPVHNISEVIEYNYQPTIKQ